jgi:hypothetical protein
VRDFTAELVRLVMEEDLSAIPIMARRLGITEEAVCAALEQLVRAGDLKGHITEDGSRFFRNDIQVADRPAVSHEDMLPDFMKYDTRPGKVVAVIGLFVLVTGYVMMIAASQDIGIENWGMTVIFLGLVLMIGGCCQISQRKTPT